MKLTTNTVFRDHTGKEVTDEKIYVKNWLKNHPSCQIFVGCDSKVRSKKTTYSTVICMWDVGKGVREIYKNEIVQSPLDSYTRLWSEVTRAVNTAYELRNLGKITVHVDINSNSKYRSYQLYDTSIGLIISMGFKGAGKPFSWAASCGAHRHCQ